MQVLVSRQNGCVIVQPVQGCLGSRFFASVQPALSTELRTGAAPVIFDASRIETVDGGGLGALLGLLRLCEPTHELVVAGASEALIRALTQAGIGGLFSLVPSMEEAMESVMPLLRLRRAVGETAVQVEVAATDPLSSVTKPLQPTLSS